MYVVLSNHRYPMVAAGGGEGLDLNWAPPEGARSCPSKTAGGVSQDEKGGESVT